MKRDQLEIKIGYKFKNEELLARALTHRSWAHENGTEENVADNERLEFIGDSVLGLVIAEHLFRENRGMDEGELTLMKHHLVSTAMLAELSKKIGLGDAVKIGRGEEKTGGRTKPAILADTLEAVIAAIFLDGGYNTAKDFIVELFANEFVKATPQSSLDYKTLLQETLQAEKLSAPHYELTGTEGKPHARTFFVEARWENGVSKGTGNSRKAAEMMAASEALKILKDRQTNNGSKQ